MKSFNVDQNSSIADMVENVLESLKSAGVDYITVGQRTEFGWNEDDYDVHIGWYTDKEIKDLVQKFADDTGCETNEITVKKNED